MKRFLNITGVLFLSLLLVSGCAKKADMNKPIEQVTAEAEKMSVGDLQSMSQAYVKEIQKQKLEIDKIKEKLKGLSLKELFGEKAKTVRDDAAKYSTNITELTKRYEIYARKFQEKGGDITKIKIA